MHVGKDLGCMNQEMSEKGLWEIHIIIYCTPFQISSKKAELGIGQQTSFQDYRFKVVDFLPAMYAQENILASQRPTEIASYDMIVLPFDKYIWFITFSCIFVQFLLLVAMQNLWSYVIGASNPDDYIFEGYALKIVEIE